MTDRPRRLDPTARRHQLLAVAREVVERDGVAACTVDAVSTEAGVTPQLVHRYFGSRASLLQELFLFPQKFLFLDVRGVAAALQALGAGSRAELFFVISQPVTLPVNPPCWFRTVV